MAGQQQNQAGVSAESEATRVERVCDQFEAAWKAGGRPDISEHLRTARLGSDSRKARELIVELVHVDLEYRWRVANGANETLAQTQDSEDTSGGARFPERPILEDYVRRYEALGDVRQLPLDLIGQEYRVRRLADDSVAIADYVRRFPGQDTELKRKLMEVEKELPAEKESLSKGNGGKSSDALSRIEPKEFARKLAASKLLSREEIQDWWRRHAKRGGSISTESFAAELIEAGDLTPYQAERIAKGDVKGLVFGNYVILDQIGAGGMPATPRTSRRKSVSSRTSTHWPYITLTRVKGKCCTTVRGTGTTGRS